MLYLIVAFVSLILLGFCYEQIARAVDVRRNPAPGQMVDVGGHRLHVRVRGQVGPTVVLEAGNGSPGLIWELVAPVVATFARVVVYDRAGYGYSEAGPLPRSGERCVAELHELLRRCAIPGPYILVGHSLGGLQMRLFAEQYRDEVAGIVLVDATHEAELTERFPPEHIKGQRMLPKMLRMLSLMSRVGLVRLMARLNMIGDITKLAGLFPARTGGLLIRLCIRSSALAAAHSEMSHVAETYALTRAAAPLGDLPLVVLTHGMPGPVMPGTSLEVAALIEQRSREVAAEMAALSSRGTLVVAEQSGHEIHVYQPELVVDAIRRVIAAAAVTDVNRPGTPLTFTQR